LCHRIFFFKSIKSSWFLIVVQKLWYEIKIRKNNPHATSCTLAAIYRNIHRRNLAIKINSNYRSSNVTNWWSPLLRSPTFPGCPAHLRRRNTWWPLPSAWRMSDRANDIWHPAVPKRWRYPLSPIVIRNADYNRFHCCTNQLRYARTKETRNNKEIIKTTRKGQAIKILLVFSLVPRWCPFWKPYSRRHPKCRITAFEPLRRQPSPPRERSRFSICQLCSRFRFIRSMRPRMLSSVGKLQVEKPSLAFMRGYSLVWFGCSERPRVRFIEHGHHLHGELCHDLDHVVVAGLITLGAMHWIASTCF